MNDSDIPLEMQFLAERLFDIDCLQDWLMDVT